MVIRTFVTITARTLHKLMGYLPSLSGVNKIVSYLCLLCLQISIFGTLGINGQSHFIVLFSLYSLLKTVHVICYSGIILDFPMKAVFSLVSVLFAFIFTTAGIVDWLQSPVSSDFFFL